MFSCGRVAFSDNREVRKKHSKSNQNGNLAIMEREAREAGGRASIASKARAERAARTARAGATRQRTAARREWREPPEDGDSKPVRSLMPLRGRCAACAGRLTWERLGHLFPVLGPIQAELGLIGADLARLGADSGGFAPGNESKMAQRASQGLFFYCKKLQEPCKDRAF